MYREVVHLMGDFLVIAAVPTRGAILTEVLQGIADNFIELGQEHPKAAFHIVTSHKQPMPDSHNSVFRKALRYRPEFIWMVEEDTVPPAGILPDMMQAALEAEVEVVLVNYRLEDGTFSLKLNREKKKVLNSGVGCMLVHRTVLQQIGDPWFDDETWIMMDDGTFAKGPHKLPCRPDVSFMKRLKDHDISTYGMLDSFARHLRLEKLGERNTNNGLHSIREL